MPLPVAAPPTVPVSPLPSSAANNIVPFTPKGAPPPAPAPLVPNWSLSPLAGAGAAGAGSGAAGLGVGATAALGVGALGAGLLAGEGLRQGGLALEDAGLIPDSDIFQRYPWEVTGGAPLRDAIAPGAAPPFTGGQSPVLYKVYVLLTGSAPWYRYDAVGPLSLVPVYSNGQLSSSFLRTGAGQQLFIGFDVQGNKLPGIMLERHDGQPDTGGNPAPIPENYRPPVPGGARQPAPAPALDPAPWQKPKPAPAPSPSPAPSPRRSPVPVVPPAPEPGEPDEGDEEKKAPPLPGLPPNQQPSAPSTSPGTGGSSLTGTVRPTGAPIPQPSNSLPQPLPQPSSAPALPPYWPPVDFDPCDLDPCGGGLDPGDLPELCPDPCPEIELTDVQLRTISCEWIEPIDGSDPFWDPQDVMQIVSAPAHLADALAVLANQTAEVAAEQCRLRNSAQASDPPDCVAIMPSESYGFVKQSILKLRFCKVDEFPRSSNRNSVWDLEIPNPIDGLDWCEHLESFRYTKGYYYARCIWSDSNHRSGAYTLNESEGEKLNNFIDSLSKNTPKRKVISTEKCDESPDEPVELRIARAYLIPFENGQRLNTVCFVPPVDGC